MVSRRMKWHWYPFLWKSSAISCQGALHTFSRMIIGGLFFCTQVIIPLNVWPDSPASFRPFFSLLRLE